MPSDITIGELADAAAGVAREQTAIAGAATLLADRLDAVAGMIGDDDPARTVGAVYDPSARAAFAGLAAAVRVLDGVATAFLATGENYLRAEQQVAPNAPLPALPRPSTAAGVTRTPAASLGPGEPGPFDVLTRWWPDAAPDRMLDAASSWAAAADAVGSAGAALGDVVAALESGNSGPDVDAMVEFWAGLLGPNSLFTDLVTLLGQLARLCRGYGELVADTQQRVRQALGILVASGVLATAAAPFTGGVTLEALPHAAAIEIEALLNPVADDFAAALPGVVRAVDAYLAAEVDRHTADLATPEAVEAELEELADATDAGLGGSAGAPPPGDAVEVPRFTADHFASADKSVLHARKHAREFGLRTEADYVHAAAQFLDRAQQSGVAARVDPDGIVRLYDTNTNTFASYDSTSGIILTFFKPTSRTYWERNESDWGKPVTWR